MKILSIRMAKYLGDSDGMEKILTDFANHIIN